MSIASMIDRAPGVCGGRAKLAGTRVPVHRVAAYYRLGCSPDEILALLSSLTLAQVHAALAYALANPEEMEQALAEEEAVGAGVVRPSVPA
jgi:type III restriction enzyme